MRYFLFVSIVFLMQISPAKAAISCDAFTYMSKPSSDGGVNIFRCVKGNHENTDNNTSKCDSQDQDGNFFFSLSSAQVSLFDQAIMSYADDEFSLLSIAGYSGAGLVAGATLGAMLGEPVTFFGGAIIGLLSGAIYGYYDEKEDYDRFMTTFNALDANVVVGTNRSCSEVELIISSAWSEATGGQRYWFGSADN